MAKERYTALQVAGAIRQARGILSAAAELLGCQRATVLAYIRRHATVRLALQESRAVLVDHAEQRLTDAVDKGEWPAVRFTLLTLGRDRGYRSGRTGDAGDPGSLPDELAAGEPAEDYSDYEQAARRVYGPPDPGSPPDPASQVPAG